MHFHRLSIDFGGVDPQPAPWSPDELVAELWVHRLGRPRQPWPALLEAYLALDRAGRRRVVRALHPPELHDWADVRQRLLDEPGGTVGERQEQAGGLRGGGGLEPLPGVP